MTVPLSSGCSNRALDCLYTGAVLEHTSVFIKPQTHPEEHVYDILKSLFEQLLSC